jgi:DNA-binding XRE family transcriptional regulator
MSIKNRTNELISLFSHGNKKVFAETVGVSPTVIENIVGRREGNPSFEVVRKILCAFENLNPEWLINGTPPMLKAKNVDDLFDKNQPMSPQVKELVDAIREISEENGRLKERIEQLLQSQQVAFQSNGSQNNSGK